MNKQFAECRVVLDADDEYRGTKEWTTSTVAEVYHLPAAEIIEVYALWAGRWFGFYSFQPIM